MIISFQGDFKEQVQKFVKFLIYTTENWWKKTNPLYFRSP
jgi:hypothetical protein